MASKIIYSYVYKAVIDKRYRIDLNAVPLANHIALLLCPRQDVADSLYKTPVRVCGQEERPRHANLTNYPHSSACHSMILFPDGHSVTSQRIKLPSLPAQAVVHIDAGHVIAAGWDGVIYTIRTVTATESSRLDRDSACLLSAKGRSLAGMLHTISSFYVVMQVLAALLCNVRATCMALIVDVLFNT